MQKIDLHVHTTASDGSFTPRKLIDHACAAGISAVAITDHDTTEGIDEATERGREKGVEVIPGIELSTRQEYEMHLLGYYINRESSVLKQLICDMRNVREKRNLMMIEKLNELNINISLSDIMKAAAGKVAGRPHMARVMMEKGYVGSIREAFEDYLSEGRKAYVPRKPILPGYAMRVILEAGGIPVLAHPKYITSSFDKLDLIIRHLKEEGLMGLEVYYTTHNALEVREYKKIAERYNLVATGGSDFHGSYKPDIEIGVGFGDLNVEYSCLENLKTLKNHIDKI